ncbi:META domain-containing protein [Streptomyces sediminimaris]|uniref:META domain-containing protein n=1 Tax=Streptomyces sediminimaris TaxID=3383721 RepID=UPI00399B5CB8
MGTPRLTLAVLTVLPLVLGCAGDGGGASAEPGVTGVHWKVDSVTVDGVTRQAPADAGAGVRFGTDGTAVGSYGCNQFGARAAFTGHRVELTHAHRTLMACEPERMAFERALSRTLTGRSLAVGTKDGELTLTARDGDRVHLTEEKDVPLYGTRWTITSLGAGGTATSLPRPARGSAHLTFGKEPGRVTGRLGCNHVTAKATVRDGRITLGPAYTTRMMCDASLMRIEKRLLRLFDGTAGYTLDHRTLTLTSGNGETAEAVAGR